MEEVMTANGTYEEGVRDGMKYALRAKEDGSSIQDYEIWNGGSILLFTPISPECVDWVDEHVHYETTWNGAIVIEPNYWPALEQGLSEAGFAA